MTDLLHSPARIASEAYGYECSACAERLYSDVFGWHSIRWGSSVCVAAARADAPELPVHFVSDKSFADRRVIIVRRGADMSVARMYSFQGPTSGCGPVFAAWDGLAESVRVDSPERFGDTFGRDWVRAYFA